MSRAAFPENRAVAFLDVLGFQALIDSVTIRRDAKLLSRLESALKRVSILRWPYRRSNLEVTAFSDSVIISGIIDHVGDVADAAARYARALLVLGFATRGAISVGWLRHQSDRVFGEALVHAYRLESRVASYPRILVADRITRNRNMWRALTARTESEHAFPGERTAWDVDGSCFLNIFSPWYSAIDKQLLDPEGRRLRGLSVKFHLLDRHEQFLALARDSIAVSLHRSTAAEHLVKWNWLRNYLNTAIQSTDNFLSGSPHVRILDSPTKEINNR